MAYSKIHPKLSKKKKKKKKILVNPQILCFLIDFNPNFNLKNTSIISSISVSKDHRENFHKFQKFQKLQKNFFFQTKQQWTKSFGFLMKKPHFWNNVGKEYMLLTKQKKNFFDCMMKKVFLINKSVFLVISHHKLSFFFHKLTYGAYGTYGKKKQAYGKKRKLLAI